MAAPARDSRPSIAAVLGAAGARTALEKMLLIREFENKVYDSFVAGLVQGTTHLCQGQEAVAVGTVMALREDDYLTYTYRGHGPCIARGMDLEATFAEIFGRSTGPPAASAAHSSIRRKLWYRRWLIRPALTA